MLKILSKQEECDPIFGDCDSDNNVPDSGIDGYDCWCSDTCLNPNNCDLIFDDCPLITCQCGNATFASDRTQAVNQRCCVTSTCESPGVCPHGHVIPVSEYCDNQNNPSVRCYNSYQENSTIGEQSHFACSDKCVPVLDMCQGIDWCTAELNQCNEDLRCPSGTSKQSLQNKPDHYYCDGNVKVNNRVFNTFDRSDETLLMFDGSALDIKTDQFPPCVIAGNDPGMKCGEKCLDSYKWCSDEYLETCGPQNISSRDWRLCENELIFTNTSCNINYNDGRPWAYGLRCSGYNKECYFPWYRFDYGDNNWLNVHFTCKDKSDQIFSIGETCEDHQQRQIEIHNSLFCTYDYLQDQEICTDTKGWLETRKERRYQDPHNCQASCLTPSPDCQVSCYLSLHYYYYYYYYCV